MRLGEGEEKIAEYYFKTISPPDGKILDIIPGNISILTNRRLIVIYRNAEESFPLNKITAVRVIFNRSWNMLLGGVGGIFFGLLVLVNWSWIIGLILLAVGCWGFYNVWKGHTYLVISHMEGEKRYVIEGKDEKLTEFVDAINGRLY